MRPALHLTAVLFLLAAGSPLRAGLQDQDPANLMPPQTMAYLELHQAGQTARELANLLRDSPFEDLLATIARIQSERPNAVLQFDRVLPGELTLLLSPEVFGEFGRFRSGAIGFQGFNKKDEPQFLGVLFTGDSHLPSFALRVLLLEGGIGGDGHVSQVGRVGGVTLYQAFQQNQSDQENDEGDSNNGFGGVVFAFTPGLVVVGTNKDHVRDAVTRFQGKNAGPTLAGRYGFRSAARLRAKPGFFVYMDGAATAEEIDRHHGQPLTDYEWKLIKRVVNPKAVRSLAANFTLHKGEAGLQAQVQLDPTQKSPLLDLLANQSVSLEHLDAVPGNSVAALTVRLSPGEDLWERGVALADQFAKETGTPDELRPSLALIQWEKANQLAVGKLLARVEAVTVALYPPAKSGKDNSEEAAEGGDASPLLIVHAKTETDARELEGQLPALLTWLGAKDKPSQQTAAGHRVLGLKVEQLGGTVWYGRHGRRLIVGRSLESVVASLTCAQQGQGLAAQERVRSVFPKQPGTLLVGIMPVEGLCLPFVADLLGDVEETGGAGKTEEAKLPESQKQIQQLKRTILAQPPLVLSLTRQADALTLELRPVSLQPLTSQVIKTVFAGAIEEILTPPVAAPKVPAAGGAPAPDPMATPPAPPAKP